MVKDSIDFTSDYGKRHAFRQHLDVQQAFGMRNTGILDKCQQAIDAGYAVTPVYAATSAKTAEHDYCSCPSGLRRGHRALHPVAPGFNVKAISVVASIVRLVGSAVTWLAVDAEGNLHELDEVLGNDARDQPSALFAPVLAAQRRQQEAAFAHRLEQEEASKNKQ